MKKTFTLLTTLFFGATIGNTVFAQCSTGESEVVVTIVEDNYGSETEWEITGPGGSPIYLSGGPYSDGNPGTSHTESVCIPVGVTATFIITDDYGDGICCAYGNGSYTVTMNGCNVVATGGEFGDDESASFVVTERQTVDLAIKSVDVNPVVPIGNVAIDGSVTNLGTDAITSFDLHYSIDNGSAVTEPMTGLNIAPCSDYSFGHSTPWNATAAGTYALKVWVDNVNGGLDTDTTNNADEKDLSVALQTVQRIPLVEELTSSTCPPCASLNQVFDPFLLNQVNANEPGSGVAAVRYQMNWPNPGTDPSYNNDGYQRRQFYGTTGIPDEYLDAQAFSPTSMSSYTAAASKVAYVDIDLTFEVDSLSVTGTAIVTPYANISGPVKLYMAVTEDHYTYNGGTTSQKEYYYVMRKMLPNGNGNTLSNITAGTPITVSKSYTFDIGNPAQGNYELWGQHPKLTLVAWVQNTSTQEVYQAAFANAEVDTTGAGQNNTGIYEDVADIGLKVYPNPFTDQTNLVYNLDKSENVTITLFNTLGEAVYVNNLGNMPAGRNNFTLNASEFSAGIYMLNVRVGDNVVSRRVSITK